MDFQSFLNSIPLMLRQGQSDLKTILILNDDVIHESVLDELFISFNNFEIYDFVLITYVFGMQELQVITNEFLFDAQLRYHNNVENMSQLFYDKSFTQPFVGMFVSNNQPPLSFYSDDQSISGVLVDFTLFFCEKLNISCKVTKSSGFMYQIHLFLKYDMDQYYMMKTESFAFTYPLEFNHYCILVPKAHVLSDLFAMIHAIEYSLFICIVIFFLICGIAWYFSVRKTLFQKSLSDIYFRLYGMLITNSYNFRLIHKYERIFCISFISLSFFVIFGYNCKLTALLVSPVYELDMNTLNDLANKNSTVFWSSEYHPIFEYFRKNQLSYLTLFTDIEGLEANRLGVHLSHMGDRKLCQLTNCKTAYLFVNSPENFKNGQLQYHVMDQQFTFKFNSFYSHIRVPLIKHIDELNKKLVESGIWQYWHNLHDLNGNGTISSFDTSNQNFLKSETILEFWKIIGLGYLIALFVFLGELIYYIVSKNNYLNILKKKLFRYNVMNIFVRISNK